MIYEKRTIRLNCDVCGISQTIEDYYFPLHSNLDIILSEINYSTNHERQWRYYKGHLICGGWYEENEVDRKLNV